MEKNENIEKISPTLKNIYIFDEILDNLNDDILILDKETGDENIKKENEKTKKIINQKKEPVIIN